MVSADEVLAWTPNNDQDHINPQYRDIDFKVPIKISEALETDVAKLVAQLLAFKTKTMPKLEEVLAEHGMFA